MKRILFILIILVSFKSYSQVNIVPMPAEIKMGKGNFTINKNTVLVLEGSGLESTANIFNEQLRAITGYKLKVQKNTPAKNAIVLNFERLDHTIPGAYNLTVDDKGVYIAGDNEPGVFYGLQTLLQLLPPLRNKQMFQTANASPLNTIGAMLPIPQLFINDYPRFEYRGMHLDVCRHFFPVTVVKKYIDYLAAHKFNNFHWHLTEDQGWRIEIKKYPKLTGIGAYRNGTIIGRYPGKGNDSIRYGGFYTQTEVKEIVQYATARYITVIPEIEMPGHSTAALASYPFLGCTKGPYKVLETWGVLDDVYCAGNDSTFVFLENVLDEVLQLFPSKYIHIGGDECPKERWKTCPLCQKRITDNHLKDEHELQSYFIQRIEKYLNSKGRKIIGWDEILEGGLAKNATVMSWRGEEGGITAAKQDHDVIMTPGTYCYLDHSQTKNEDSVTIGGYLPLEKVYSYEPVPAVLNAEQAKHILGAQGNVWTEYIGNVPKLEYMIFPRMSALSEVLWTPKDKRNWNDFERRLPSLMRRYESWKANYSFAYYDLVPTIQPGILAGTVEFKLETKDKGLAIRYVDKSRMAQTTVKWPDANGVMRDTVIDVTMGMGKLYTGPIVIDSNNTVYVSSYRGKEQVSNTITQQFHFNKATGRPITLVNAPGKSYPGNGAFTLVDGVQNEKGLSRSNEFLGFLGKDLDATIDLGKTTDIKEVRLHTFTQIGSWIYPPAQNVTVLISNDGINFTMPENEIGPVEPVNGITKINFSFSKDAVPARYVKVIAKNYGLIPAGNPGAGNPAWLFVDEIEIE
jgi:hexosaminidase